MGLGDDFGEDIQTDGGEHEARAERDEGLHAYAAGWRKGRQQPSAQQIAARCQQAEDQHLYLGFHLDGLLEDDAKLQEMRRIPCDYVRCCLRIGTIAQPL